MDDRTKLREMFASLCKPRPRPQAAIHRSALELLEEQDWPSPDGNVGRASISKFQAINWIP
jgi:hypothetical protein